MTFDQYKYIFVLTYARSGSTLLQALLNTVDKVQIRGENNNALFHIYKTIDGITHAKNEHGPASKQPDTPWYGADNLTPIGFKERMLNVFVTGVLKPHEGMETIGFKEIRHIPHFMSDTDFKGYCDFLLDAFPDARIVFNSRNAESVSQSAWLKTQNPKEVIRSVQIADTRFRTYAEGTDRAIHMKYEKYVSDFGEISRMFRFLKLDFDEEKVKATLARPLTHAK